MKQKTKKAAKKRFTFSARGKVQHLHTGRAHFNARATGNKIRERHRPAAVDATDLGRVERLLPYD